MFICADHGNAEQLVDYETGAPFTAHTTKSVPFILVTMIRRIRCGKADASDIVPRSLRDGNAAADRDDRKIIAGA